MHKINTIPGRTVVMEGRECLYFSGTSYLGMSCNEDFSNLIEEGINKYGNNYSSSRISNLQLDIFEEAECYLADACGSEAALTMSSGYLAGQIVVQMLLEQHVTHFIYEPKTHPALWRTRNDFSMGSQREWETNILLKIKGLPPGKIAILCNAIDPLYAIKHSFAWIKDLPADKEIFLVIDDSHGLGITGKNGAGILSEIKAPEGSTLIVVSSLGKALGIPGGVVFSKKSVIEEIKKSAFFGGSSPAVPAYLYAFLKAKNIYRRAKDKLLENISLFSRKIDSDQFNFIHDYPVFYTKNRSMAEKLFNNNIIISCFPYPTSEDEWITRIILNSLHTEADIDALVAGIKP